MNITEIRERLHAIGVVNTHDLLLRFGRPGKTDICCAYHPAIPRAVTPACTRVYSPSHKTDPKAHWMDRGCSSHLGGLAESMPLAQAWATKRYGIKEWVQCPTDRSNYIPKEVWDLALAAIAPAPKRGTP